MAKKLTHPDIQLFDYLNGAVDAEAARQIEAHLSACNDCSSVAVLVRSIKPAAMEPEGQPPISDQSQRYSEHPDVSELAYFFYSTSQRAESSRVAAHVALCPSCAEEIAEYARADHAANHYTLNKASQGEVPASAWEMIHDWEGSSFAKLRPASEALGQELLTRLSQLLGEQATASRTKDSARHEAERVPVL